MSAREVEMRAANQARVKESRDSREVIEIRRHGPRVSENSRILERQMIFAGPHTGGAVLDQLIRSNEPCFSYEAEGENGRRYRREIYRATVKR